MLLAIDMGNTNIKLGLYDNDKQIDFTRFKTRQHDYYDLIRLFLKANNLDYVEDAIISCVTPSIIIKFKEDLKTFIKNEIIEVNYHTDLGINIISETPEIIGNDLLVMSSYAYHLTHKASIVVSFGTATVFVYTDLSGNYRYAMIAPGFEAAYKTLFKDAENLNDTPLSYPKTVLATNTFDALNAGIVEGYVGLTNHLISKMKEELNNDDIAIIICGGNAEILTKGIEDITTYKADFVTEGLSYIYLRNKK